MRYLSLQEDTNRTFFEYCPLNESTGMQERSFVRLDLVVVMDSSIKPLRNVSVLESYHYQWLWSFRYLPRKAGSGVTPDK